MTTDNGEQEEQQSSDNPLPEGLPLSETALKNIALANDFWNTFFKESFPNKTRATISKELQEKDKRTVEFTATNNDLTDLSVYYCTQGSTRLHFPPHIGDAIVVDVVPEIPENDEDVQYPSRFGSLPNVFIDTITNNSYCVSKQYCITFTGQAFVVTQIGVFDLAERIKEDKGYEDFPKIEAIGLPTIRGPEYEEFTNFTEKDYLTVNKLLSQYKAGVFKKDPDRCDY